MVKTQIKAKQTAIRTSKASMSPNWSAFKLAAKKEDPSGVLSSLSSLLSLSRQIIEEKQKILKLENRISDIIAAAKAQIP
ncbi:hypothetical protein [Paenibacillus sp. N3.4]|uniref:hypothetical protein n=1 Tax=Paenibacillus sp. N3.4 TaxID=2603222 RepID=UPI0011C7F207|nr:hypothetical protein [Paenibacillus sp. N3.4]TXK81449.1 hypothetical protein FU659_16245 [Paenibacillus sp. N3.4]